jgi:hypothetical protein
LSGSSQELPLVPRGTLRSLLDFLVPKGWRRPERSSGRLKKSERLLSLVISAAYLRLEDLKGPVRLEESLKDLRSLKDFLVPERGKT